MEIQDRRRGTGHWTSTSTMVWLQVWTGKDGCFSNRCAWTAASRRADLEGWLQKHLVASDLVVIESTTNAWPVYDLLEALAERGLVANPIKANRSSSN